jgi:nicotinic acid phosphoribosyltransferase
MRENPLLIDLYERTMADAYLANGMIEPAVFEFFVRKLPARRGFSAGGRPRSGNRLSHLAALRR